MIAWKAIKEFHAIKRHVRHQNSTSDVSFVGCWWVVTGQTGFASLLRLSSFIPIFLGCSSVSSSSGVSALIRVIYIELFYRVNGMVSFLWYMIGLRTKGSV